MSRKVLRPCTVCRRPYHAAYLVTDPTYGKLYLCRACWEAFQAGQLQLKLELTPHTSRSTTVDKGAETHD
jgi:hypothetical protein